MDVENERCCGLDIHKKVGVACLLTPGARGGVTKEIRSFGTMTEGLIRLSDWLLAAGCTHVAMESTGVYWKPIYNLLENRFNLLLVNAQHIKAVPGHKTDVKDSEWIAELLRHGLLRGSFVPDREQRELRELTRYRSSLVRERSAEVNRLQKTLEGANIKLASVVSDVTGASARDMLRGLLAGTASPAALAQLARRRLREKIPDLERALTGQFGPHQCFLVAQHLAHIDALDEQIAQLSAEIADRMRPFEELLQRLDEIPGVGRWTAEVILAEIGTDMSRWRTAGHLASWAGMCPGNNESAGKRKSGKTRKGDPWLTVSLTEAAYAAGRSKNTYLSDHYHRLAARRGRKRAGVATGHSILIIAYHMIKDGTHYTDLGPTYLDQRKRDSLERQLIRRLQSLGNEVTIVRRKPKEAA